jgi:hypothetical protein
MRRPPGRTSFSVAFYRQRHGHRHASHYAHAHFVRDLEPGRVQELYGNVLPEYVDRWSGLPNNQTYEDTVVVTGTSRLNNQAKQNTATRELPAVSVADSVPDAHAASVDLPPADGLRRERSYGSSRARDAYSAGLKRPRERPSSGTNQKTKKDHHE